MLRLMNIGINIYTKLDIVSKVSFTLFNIFAYTFINTVIKIIIWIKWPTLLVWLFPMFSLILLNIPQITIINNIDITIFMDSFNSENRIFPYPFNMIFPEVFPFIASPKISFKFIFLSVTFSMSCIKVSTCKSLICSSTSSSWFAFTFCEFVKHTKKNINITLKIVRDLLKSNLNEIKRVFDITKVKDYDITSVNEYAYKLTKIK